eukprot:6467024-Amphidinium_carterae.1
MAEMMPQMRQRTPKQVCCLSNPLAPQTGYIQPEIFMGTCLTDYIFGVAIACSHLNVGEKQS